VLARPFNLETKVDTKFGDNELLYSVSVHDLERVDPKSQLLCKTGLCLDVDIESPCMI
jgi:hypothetical protein